MHVSGKRYVWEVSSHPDDVPVAETPAWLLEMIAKPLKSRSRDDQIGSTIPKGQRNSKLASLAGTMRRRGMTHQAILAALLAENAARCRPPLAEAEVRSIADSIGRYQPGQQSALYFRVSTVIPIHIATVEELLTREVNE